MGNPGPANYPKPQAFKRLFQGESVGKDRDKGVGKSLCFPFWSPQLSLQKSLKQDRIGPPKTGLTISVYCRNPFIPSGKTQKGTLPKKATFKAEMGRSTEIQNKVIHLQVYFHEQRPFALNNDPSAYPLLLTKRKQLSWIYLQSANVVACERSSTPELL